MPHTIRRPPPRTLRAPTGGFVRPAERGLSTLAWCPDSACRQMLGRYHLCTGGFFHTLPRVESARRASFAPARAKRGIADSRSHLFPPAPCAGGREFSHQSHPRTLAHGSKRLLVTGKTVMEFSPPTAAHLCARRRALYFFRIVLFYTVSFCHITPLHAFRRTDYAFLPARAGCGRERFLYSTVSGVGTDGVFVSARARQRSSVTLTPVPARAGWGRIHIPPGHCACAGCAPQK